MLSTGHVEDEHNYYCLDNMYDKTCMTLFCCCELTNFSVYDQMLLQLLWYDNQVDSFAAQNFLR